VTVGLHGLLALALLQTRAVHEAVFETAPILVRLVSQPQAARPSEPVLPPLTPAAPRLPSLAPLPLPLVTPADAQPSPQAVLTRVAPADPGPVTLPSPAPAMTASAPAIAPAPPSPPRVIPAAAVQFTLPPVIEYPRLARRNAEAGLVIVRAWVDAHGGAPRSVQVERSSGFARLDQAALAAVQKARFKPHSENGQAVEGWALVPIRFELES
jgi:protein TonB